MVPAFLKAMVHRSGSIEESEYHSLSEPSKPRLSKAATAREIEKEQVQVQLKGMEDALAFTQKVRALLAPAPHLRAARISISSDLNRVPLAMCLLALSLVRPRTPLLRLQLGSRALWENNQGASCNQTLQSLISGACPPAAAAPANTIAGGGQGQV